MPPVAATLVCCASACAGAALLSLAQDPWRIEGRFEADRDRLILAGSTDLPHNAVLRIDFFEADTERRRELASQAVRVSREGSFRFEASPFEAPIPPGRYHARVRLIAALQDRTRVLRALESSGRPPDAEACFNLQIGTARDRIEAALAHAGALAASMDEIVHAIDAALADPRARLPVASDAVDRIRRERGRQEALDRHFWGESPEEFEAVARCAKNALQALRDPKPDVATARIHRDAAAEWAREGRIRLGLKPQQPESLGGIIRLLRASLLGNPELDSPAWEPMLLRLAKTAGSGSYALVVELSLTIEAILFSRHEASARRRLEELLQALETGPP